MRIALFATCLVDGLFPDVGLAAATVLRRLGHRVDLPTRQSCCGQMHVNTGYPDHAVPLIRNYVDTFAEYEAIVAPSASCVGSVRHQHVRTIERAADAGLATAARNTAARTYEFCEFLVDVLGVTDVGAHYAHSVAYHPTCHSLRMLRAGDRPYRLLQAVRGLDLRSMPRADSCCGFGGTFALKNADISVAMLSDKIEDIHASGAEVCTAGDASCLMHIGGGLLRSGSATRAVHIAEILASTT